MSQGQKTLKFYRVNLKPESGRSKGLTLMLDGHNDIVADSSVPDDFQVCYSRKPSTIIQVYLSSMDPQGFVAIVDSKTEFPLSTKRSLIIRPGHTVWSNQHSLFSIKVSVPAIFCRIW